MPDTLTKYRVWLHSPAGMWEHYSGYVDVCAEDEEEAGVRARNELHRTSFPDRSTGSWIIDRVETR